MAKKQSFFDFFFDFLKNCPYDSNEIFYSHSTPYYGPICAMASKSYGWDVRNIAKISPKMAKKQPFFDFFTNCSYDSNESESEGKRLKPTPLPHMRLWLLFQGNLQNRTGLKSPPFRIFRHCDFFPKILKCPKGSPFEFFVILQQNA